MWTVCAFGASQPAQTFNHKKKHDVSRDYNRSPVYVPSIDVLYDSETLTIDVECLEEVEAVVYVYDSAHNLVGYSTELNHTFTVPISGIYIVYIDSDFWYVESKVEI